MTTGTESPDPTEPGIDPAEQQPDHENTEPGSPSEPTDFPETDPETEANNPDEQPGQMPASTNTEVGA